MIEIGKIINTHGIRGDVKVDPWCDGIETYKFLKSVFVKNNEYKIQSVKQHKNAFLLKLDGVESINEAELLKGAVIMAKEEDMPPLPDGVYYLRDIMGLNVYEGERYIGQIYDWIETGPTNVYVIKRDFGKDVLIPAIDDVVLNIDIENKIMSVKLMEGLVQDDN